MRLTSGKLSRFRLAAGKLETSDPVQRMLRSVTPSYYGYVSETNEALLLIQATIQGELPLVQKRPEDKEKNFLIRSGNIFIYEAGESGIKRWTDGLHWSPSRVLGNFLLYRQLHDKHTKNQPVPRKSRKKSEPELLYNRGTPDQIECRLHGPLTDVYDFVEDGLVKKSITVRLGNKQYHLISYYRASHVLSGELEVPSRDESLKHIEIGPELANQKDFRMAMNMKLPIEAGPLYMENESFPGFYEPHPPEVPLYSPEMSKSANVVGGLLCYDRDHYKEPYPGYSHLPYEAPSGRPPVLFAKPKGRSGGRVYRRSYHSASSEPYSLRHIYFPYGDTHSC